MSFFVLQGGKGMIKTKRRNTYIAFVFAGILVMLGITLASALSITRSTDVDVYPVILNTNVDFVEDLQDVVNGETIVNSVTLERTTDSKDIFVRADLHYYKYGSLSDADKRFLLAINYDDISTYEGTSYKWVRAEDGYYYLTDPDGIPLKITDNTRYTFCEGITYQGAKCINNDTPAPLDLKLDVTIQAINAKNVTTTTLEETATLFNSNYTPRPVMGYIVAFDTGDAGAVPAQTFFAEGQKVTEPPEPTKLGFNFAGWYTDSRLTTPYDFNSVIDHNFTLYADFVEVCTVTFMSEGSVYESVTVEKGTSVSAPDIDPVSTSANMVFQGWYTDTNYDTKYNFDTIVTTNINVYALFIRQYTVTFMSEGEIYETVKILEGGTVSAPTTEPTSTVDGLIFKNWYADEYYSTKYDFNDQVTSDTTIYAKFWNGIFDYGEYTTGIFAGKYYLDMGEYPQSLAGVTASEVTATSEQITIGTTACTVYQNNTTDDRYVRYNSNYYLIEPVRWIILDYEEGYDTSTYNFDNFTIDGQNAYIDTAKSTPYTGTNGQPGLLLLSEKVLNSSEFNPSFSDGNQYSSSTLKATIDRMYDELFTVSQQNLIKSTTVNSTYNDGSPHYGGDSVTTKLFPLGCQYNASYTDNYDVNDYLPTDSERIVYTTELVSSSGSTYIWWLRSGVYNVNKYVHYVYTSGSLNHGNVFGTLGVRVAFVFTPTPPYTFGELEVDHASGKKYYVEMGEYPQSLASVSSSDVTATSEQITIDDTACIVYQNNTTDDRYVLYNSNYYLIEPVRWIILGYEEGYDTSTYKFANFTIDGQNAYIDTAKSTPYTGTNGQPGLLLLSEKLLISSQFDTTNNNYSDSVLKTNNELLYEQIFSIEQKELIKTISINSTYYDNGAHYGTDMFDAKLFPLSRKYNSSYTDNYDLSNYLSSTTSRQATPTDLGKASGIYTNSSTGMGYWWLRSGNYNTASNAYYVYTSGTIANGAVTYANRGMRVAFVMTFA